MGPHASYFLDVTFSVVGLFLITYIVYGRTKKKPLIGESNATKRDYHIFRRIVGNNRYLAITVLGTLFFIVNAAIDMWTILRSSSPHTILVVAPVLNILLLFIAIALAPSLLGQKRK